MNKIEIYTNNNCGYCKAVKEEFEKQNIEFENKNTEDYKEEWQDIVNLTGMPTVPTIKYKGEFLVAGRDFGNPTNLIDIISNGFKSNIRLLKIDSNSWITLEKIKTMNYNMGQAFGRLDQLLRQIETITHKYQQ
jgi:glutaredoxin